MNKSILIISLITFMLSLLATTGWSNSIDQDLPVTIEGDATICEGTTTTLTATPGYITYSWNTGDFTEFTTVNQTGVYSVLVTDETGCTGIDYFDVEVLEGTSFFIDGPDEICAGLDDVVLSLSESFSTYEWSEGSTTPSITISECDTYTVTVTNNQGCTQTESITVSCPPSIDIILIENSSVSCIGECDGVLEAGIADNDGSTSMVWSTGSFSPKIENLCPGEYGVTVTDITGCYSSKTFTIAEPDTFALDIDSLIMPTCYDDNDGFLSVEATGGTSPYLYFWPDGSTGNTRDNLGSGTYAVTIVDANNCDTILPVTIPDIIPLMVNVETTIDVACHGDSTGVLEVSGFGGHGGYIYQWSTGDQTPQLTNLTVDTYAVTLVDTLGCMTTSFLPINENPPLTGSTIITNPSQQGANDGSITVSGSGGSGAYKYKWSDGHNTPTKVYLSPGTYYCTITDTEECSVELSATISEGNCLLSMTTNSSNIDCHGGTDGSIDMTTQYGILPVETFVTDIEGNLLLGDNLQAGSYLAVAQDAAGCKVEQEVIISEPSELSIDIELMEAPTCGDMADGVAKVSVLGGTSPYQYSWSNGKTSETAQELTSGMNSVIVTDAKGCEISGSLMIEAQDDIAPVLTLQPMEIELDPDGTVELPSPEMFIESLSDNCSEITIAFLEEPSIGCHNAEYDITIIATDSENNTVEQTTTLTVSDKTPPSIICPEAIVIGECETLSYIVNTEDNCHGDVVVRIIDGYNSGEDIPVGSSHIIVEAEDSNGNTAACTFQVTKLATPEIDTDKIDVKCHGDTTGAIDIVNEQDYQSITIDGAGSSLDNLSSGNYTISAVTPYGCQVQTTVTILAPNPLTSAVLDYLDESHSGSSDGYINLDISGGVEPYALVWYKDGEVIPQSDRLITDLPSGDYQCEIMDGNACVILSDILTLGTLTSVNDIELSQDILNIYPNPATNMITIEVSNEALHIESVNILDINGKMQYNDDEINKPISVANWSEGIYLIQVITDQGKVAKRLMKL